MMVFLLVFLSIHELLYAKMCGNAMLFFWNPEYSQYGRNGYNKALKIPDRLLQFHCGRSRRKNTGKEMMI